MTEPNIDETEDNTAQVQTSNSRPGPAHTSIVYFHGMGTPKRYEELTRVLDTLDRYAESKDDSENVGRLRNQIVKLETSRVGGDDPIAFINFFRIITVNRKATRRVGGFRLYESYWSPAAAGGVQALQVLEWIIARIWNPFVVLMKPWRAHQRLKLTFLSRFAFDKRRVPTEMYRLLQKYFRSFENMDLRRKYPKGKFKDFLKHIKDQSTDNAQATGLQNLARQWRNRLVTSQLEVLGVGSLVVALLISLATLLFGSVIRLLDYTHHSTFVPHNLVEKANLMPAWMPAIALVALYFAAGFGQQFFRNFLSDVVFWTTTYEKDARHQKRRDILRACEATLRHVLSDPNCDRVVIVAHSLGTAIAYETLLNLGRRAKSDLGGTGGNALVAQLDKLSHFITFGSPIDRIAYFFSLHYSRYHRFNRVVDALAGTTADMPFRINKLRKLQWINIRDNADPISSRLFAPRSPVPNREDIVEISVSSGHAPNPVAAHIGYFDSILSAKILFDACILNSAQVQAQDQRPKWSRYFKVGSQPVFLALVTASILSLTAGAAAFWMNCAWLAPLSQFGFAWSIIGLTLVCALGTWLDGKHKLTLPA